ncbi:hypothetical protein DUI87_11398 [Hirundo rustica rustica]|uniref:Uncharacterized protein n=1 Tax=Hirundo rustica rustica TaxID=333673 RepID=A0A3M0KDM4_HIRRU|nr:hypothetical protein DUI87_11398 [Hirundo rustica rustica]
MRLRPAARRQLVSARGPESRRLHLSPRSPLSHLQLSRSVRVQRGEPRVHRDPERRDGSRIPLLRWAGSKLTCASSRCLRCEATAWSSGRKEQLLVWEKLGNSVVQTLGHSCNSPVVFTLFSVSRQGN